VIASCSGTAGLREHAGEVVTADHCANHACASRPEPRHLGEGCYIVEDPGDSREYLYDCSTDLLPVGGLVCTDVTPCTGYCSMSITFDDRPMAIGRCLHRWSADRRARHPQRCSVPHLQVVIDSIPTQETTLALPTDVVMEVVRTGMHKMLYTAEACVTSGGILVTEPTRRTGFYRIDPVLARIMRQLANTGPVGSCATVTLVVSHFECEIEAVST
jgi:hypothetical protein